MMSRVTVYGENHPRRPRKGLLKVAIKLPPCSNDRGPPKRLLVPLPLSKSSYVSVSRSATCDDLSADCKIRQVCPEFQRLTLPAQATTRDSNANLRVRSWRQHDLLPTPPFGLHRKMPPQPLSLQGIRGWKVQRTVWSQPQPRTSESVTTPPQK